jgi:hypothetical protein
VGFSGVDIDGPRGTDLGVDRYAGRWPRSNSKRSLRVFCTQKANGHSSTERVTVLRRMARKPIVCMILRAVDTTTFSARSSLHRPFCPPPAAKIGFSSARLA